MRGQPPPAPAPHEAGEGRRAFAFPWIPPPRAGDIVIVGGWPEAPPPPWAPPHLGQQPPPPTCERQEVPPALKNSLIAISSLDLVSILALFVTDLTFDSATITTAQWLLLPMFLNRLASLIAIWKNMLNVAPSMLQICLSLINLVLAMQNSRMRCEYRSAVQCLPVGIAASLLIAEISFMLGILFLLIWGLGPMALTAIFFTLVIVFLVMWAPLCCMGVIPRRADSSTAAMDEVITAATAVPAGQWIPQYRMDTVMQPGDIECGSCTKVKATSFVKVENPGDDTYILAVRVPDPPQVAPKRSRSGRRRRETTPAAPGEAAREAAIRQEAARIAENGPAEPTQVPPGNPPLL